MSKETKAPDGPTLTWAAGVWSRLSVVECVGVLWMALRYNPRDFNPQDFNPFDIGTEGIGAYIDRMSLLPWLSLGEPLQRDIALALDQLRQRFHSR